mmetsp:Transcript_5166/g.14522  ORF Transcript_5166/g.14522 Transcript_5166/m.14522 type:complete len:270 (+) Transcript_5166:293-1102(+)
MKKIRTPVKQSPHTIPVACSARPNNIIGITPILLVHLPLNRPGMNMQSTWRTIAQVARKLPSTRPSSSTIVSGAADMGRSIPNCTQTCAMIAVVTAGRARTAHTGGLSPASTLRGSGKRRNIAATTPKDATTVMKRKKYAYPCTWLVGQSHWPVEALVGPTNDKTAPPVSTRDTATFDRELSTQASAAAKRTNSAMPTTDINTTETLSKPNARRGVSSKNLNTKNAQMLANTAQEHPTRKPDRRPYAPMYIAFGVAMSTSMMNHKHRGN